MLLYFKHTCSLLLLRHISTDAGVTRTMNRPVCTSLISVATCTYMPPQATFKIYVYVVYHCTIRVCVYVFYITVYLIYVLCVCLLMCFITGNIALLVFCIYARNVVIQCMFYHKRDFLSVTYL